MFKVFFMVVAALALCHGLPVESEGQWDWRVVGGSDAAVGAAPYQVSLRTSTDFHFCAGTIITPKTIMTAAHCVAGRKPSSTFVIAGTNKLDAGGTKYEASDVIVHKDFNGYEISNDIALVILSSPITMTDLVKQITPSEAETGGDVVVNLTGWGTTTYPGNAPNDLQTINLKTTTYEDCKKAHTGVNSVFESQICTLTKAGEGACHGDSGGPLVDIATGAQVGIVSWGRPCAKGFPDVFTRVSSFIPWINDNKVD